MNLRKIPAIVFGLIVGSYCFYILLVAYFPRVQNDRSCENSTPENPAQRAALEDARSRVSDVCAGSNGRCKFIIHDLFNSSGQFRISHYVVKKDFFEGCIYEDESLDVFVYDSDGRFVQAEGAPYG